MQVSFRAPSDGGNKSGIAGRQAIPRVSISLSHLAINFSYFIFHPSNPSACLAAQPENASPSSLSLGPARRLADWLAGWLTRDNEKDYANWQTHLVAYIQLPAFVPYRHRPRKWLAHAACLVAESADRRWKMEDGRRKFNPGRLPYWSRDELGGNGAG